MSTAHGRIRAISLPCPTFVPVSTKVASILACAAMTASYVAWAVALWKGFYQLSEIKAASGGTEYDQLVLMARYSAFTAWFAVTAASLCLGALVVSIWPQPETAKWLSRMIWGRRRRSSSGSAKRDESADRGLVRAQMVWLASWAFGIFGIVSYLSSDAFLAAGCERGDECWQIRQGLQVGLVIAVFATLAIVFYCGIILSSYVHTLHPHLFISPDSDSDDDYSDVEEHRAQELEHEIMRSGHPYAGEALKLLYHERQQLAAERSMSRRRSGYTPEKDDDELPLAPPSSSATQQRGAPRRAPREYSSSESEGSSASHSGSGSSDEERAVLVGGGGGSSSRRKAAGATTSRGRPPSRAGSAAQLSDISSSGVESASGTESEARELGRRGRGGSESSVSRSRSRSRRG